MENKIFVLFFLLEIIIITTNVYDGVKNTTILETTIESILDMHNPKRDEVEIRYIYVPVNMMDKFSDEITTEDAYHTGLTLHNEILIDMCKYTNNQDNSYISSHIRKALGM